ADPPALRRPPDLFPAAATSRCPPVCERRTGSAGKPRSTLAMVPAAGSVLSVRRRQSRRGHRRDLVGTRLPGSGTKSALLERGRGKIPQGPAFPAPRKYHF